MLDRVIEVLSVYGAVMLVVFLIGRSTKEDTRPLMLGWTLIAWVPGLIYIIMGFLPGQ